MKRQLRIFLTGLLVVVPFAITVWVIWKAGSWLDEGGVNLFIKPIWDLFRLDDNWPLENVHGVGAVLLVVSVYLVGLLMHFWMFRRAVDLMAAIFRRVPGVKTIYESVRDLLNLFDPRAAKTMGKVVEYVAPGSEMGILGILTNDQPEGAFGDEKAAVYLPLAYMIGGPVVFLPRDHLRDVDMPVEKALRLCATAQVAASEDDEPRRKDRKAQTAR